MTTESLPGGAQLEDWSVRDTARPCPSILWASCAVLVLLLASCGNHRAPAPGPRADPVASTESKAPVPESTFIDGPSITPEGTLREWLEGHEGTLIRLPLAIEMSGLGVGPAWISTTGADAGDDAIHVSLDQGALGIGLSDRLRPLCGSQPTRCVVWLQGYWGPTVAGGPTFDGLDTEGSGNESFSVRDVVGLVAEGDRAVVQIVAPED